MTADHPQLRETPPSPAIPSVMIFLLEHSEIIMLKLRLQTIYRGIPTDTPNPSPPTLSACV